MTRAVYEEGYSKEDARLGYRASQLERRPVEGSGAGIYQIENNEVDIPVVAGDNQFQWEVPEDLDGAVLLKVEAYVTEPSTSGNIQVQIAKRDNDGTGAAVDMLTTKIQIDVGDLNSRTSAVQPEVNATNEEVAWGDHLRIDVDTPGSGATGLGLVAYFTPAATKALAVQGSKGDPGGVTAWTGQWDPSPATYTTGQAVSNNGASYVATTNVPVDIEPGVTPGWESYWMVLNEGSEFAVLTIFNTNQGREMDIGTKAACQVPFPCELVSHVLLADKIGSVVIDIWKDTYANYPPTNADSITASAPPTLSSTDKATDSTLTGWTTSIAEGDILYFVVESVSVITWFSLNLKVRRL